MAIPGIPGEGYVILVCRWNASFNLIKKWDVAPQLLWYHLEQIELVQILCKHNPISLRFQKYDTDKSGYISKEEFRVLCFSMGYRLNSEELEIDMKILGSKEGQISYRDCKIDALSLLVQKWWKSERRFVQLQLSAEELQKFHQIEKAFRSYSASYSHTYRYDEDGNGTIDANEFMNMHRELLRKVI
jgi:Ca2+-binding EF-hand superfamily protein